MKLYKGIKELVSDAASRTTGISPNEAVQYMDNADALFVDVRDVRELYRDGMIPGAFHAPRGMLEFWVDPESPYYKPVFSEGKRLILYCTADWRATLAAAALVDMGVQNVYHLEGGLKEWKRGGRPWSTKQQPANEVVKDADAR